MQVKVLEIFQDVPTHPGGNQGANPKSISHRCYLREAAFERELNEKDRFAPGLSLGWCTRERTCRSLCTSLLFEPSSLLLPSLELSDTQVYEPLIRDLLGTASQFCRVVVLKSRTESSGITLSSTRERTWRSLCMSLGVVYTTCAWPGFQGGASANHARV